ncbi:MAG TPA: glycosyltransferase family 39 protein [Chloroflexota bacterium]|nr:glycosyltransferase family 39 protein [Chloroflexota bacterium]
MSPFHLVKYNARRMWKRYVPILLILLLAFGLRLAALTSLPPGLTHDEANHGREAIGILDGVLLFYFPLNYGSEPLYSYTVAGFMALLGEGLLALRLVNVMAGTAVIAAVYAWANRAFDRRVTLVTAVLIALSFWPLASSREALRAGLLPLFMTLAVWFFWRLFERRSLVIGHWSLVIGFGVCVAVTLHIYLAARVAWLLFPLFLLYLLLAHRPHFWRMWRPTLAGLLLAALLVTPMFLYLERYPYALTRLDMLDRPLNDLRQGNLLPVARNAAGALLAFVWPGQGDQFLAYNIPGRPVFEAVTAVFFLTGIAVCLWRWRQPNAAFLLLWFGVGVLPSLITGATANTTRNLAALPAVYMLPAVGFWAAATWVVGRWPRYGRGVTAVTLTIWLLWVGAATINDYFIRWGQSPDVRGAYQRNLVEALAYLDSQEITQPVLLSTVYPGPAHDPSIALVLAGDADFRWSDARYALVLPGGRETLAVIPASTPLHPWLAALAQPQQTISLRPDDLDPSFTLVELAALEMGDWDMAASPVLSAGVNLNDALTLRQAIWLTDAVAPGGVAELLTIWQVQDPARVGPIVPPAFTTDVVMFTQVLAADGRPLAQRDSLEAPSWGWQPGDVILQIHAIPIPADTPPGEYPVIVGIYDRTSGARLPVLDESGTAVDDKITGPLLVIRNP